MPPVSQTGPEKAKQVSSSKINKTSAPSELLFSEEQNERVELERMPEIPALRRLRLLSLGYIGRVCLKKKQVKELERKSGQIYQKIIDTVPQTVAGGDL